MFVAYAVIAILLAPALVMSAYTKLARNERVVQTFTGQLGVPLGLYPVMAACEIAGAAGLIIGLWYGPLGIAAAVGLVLYFVGAVFTHLRKRDFKGVRSPVLILVIAAVAVTLRVATL
jgi:Na+-translocating ferredoxin:NAD+ oxidoreductase RnfE subunit